MQGNCWSVFVWKEREREREREMKRPETLAPSPSRRDKFNAALRSLSACHLVWYYLIDIYIPSSLPPLLPTFHIPPSSVFHELEFAYDTGAVDPQKQGGESL